MKKLNSILAVSIIVILTISMFALLSNISLPGTSTASAQATSTVPSNMLQYTWLGIQDTPNEDYSTNAPAPSSPDVLWQNVYKTAPGANEVAFNGMLFITIANNVTALDPETGNTIYTITVPTPVAGRTPTASYVTQIDSTHMTVMSTLSSSISNTTTLLAAYSICGYNIANGQLLWSTPAVYTPSTYLFAYVNDTHMIYGIVGNSTGRGGTQNPGDIEAWSLPNPAVAPTLAWTYVGQGPIYLNGGFLYGEDTLFVGGSDPWMNALNATTGQPLWTTQLTGAPEYGGSYGNGAVFIGLLDNTFDAINGTTGAIIWSFNPNDFGFWSSATAYANGIAYETNVDGYLYAFNATTGNVIWKYLGPGEDYPGYEDIANGLIYDNTGQNQFSPATGIIGPSQYSCLNATTGQVIWQIPNEFNSGPSTYIAIAYGNFYGIDNQYANGTSETHEDTNPASPTLGTANAGSQYVLYCFSGTPQNWNEYGQDPAHDAVGYGAPTNLTQTWVFHTGGTVTSSPAVVNGYVYVGSYDQNIYCLNAYTGTEVWNFTTGYYVFSSPTVVNGFVYTGADDGNVYCLNAATGALVWKTPAPGERLPITLGTYPEFDSSPVVVNGLLYVGALNGKMYCLNAATGAIDWTLQTTGAICSTPTYAANGGLYFASVDGFVYDVNPTTGAVIWNTTTPIGIEIAMEGSVTIGDGLAVIGSGGAKNDPAGVGQMYALNATTGKFVWVYTLDPSSGNLQPTWTALYINTVALGPVFYYTDFFDLVCVNATNGKQIWESYLDRESFCLASYSGGYVYTGRMTNGIYVNNAATGAKVGYFDAGAEVASSIAVYDDHVYFGCFNFNVYCLGQSSSGTTYIGNPVAPTPTPAPTPAPTPTPTASPTPAPGFLTTLGNDLNTVLGAAILIIIVVFIMILAVTAVILRKIGSNQKSLSSSKP